MSQAQLLEVGPVAPRVEPGTRPLRVAVAGCGAVGGALVRLMAAEAAAIAALGGARTELASVLVRDAGRDRGPAVARSAITADPAAFLRAPAEVVVEVTGDVAAGLAIGRAALGRGGRFVTANKALLAAHGPELAELARLAGGRLDFEGAVGGGIPVVRALRESLVGSGVVGVRGVLNGTSNYLLTRLADGASWAQALAEAQQKGFAEADPSRDVDGRDAAAKVAILAWLAFGVDPAALPIRRRGIAPGAERLVADARALGGVVRLVGECAITPAGVAAVVEPVLVPARSALGGVVGEENLVTIETRWNGSIRLAGPGAGGEPTAAAVLADLIHPARPIPPLGDLPVVTDGRAHRWSVSVAGGRPGAEALRELLERVGVPGAIRHVGRDGVSRAVTEPVAWPRADLLERALGARGLHPVVARYEMEG